MKHEGWNDRRPLQQQKAVTSVNGDGESGTLGKVVRSFVHSCEMYANNVKEVEKKKESIQMFADFNELIRLETQISTLSSVSRKMGYDSDIVLLSQ